MLTPSDLKKLQAILVTKDEFMTRLDEVLFELRSIREEMAAMFYRQREHSNQLEQHQAQLEQLLSSRTAKSTPTGST